MRRPLVQSSISTTPPRPKLDRKAYCGSFPGCDLAHGRRFAAPLPIAERNGRRAAFVEALGRARMITCGPKPARALRELGLRPAFPPRRQPPRACSTRWPAKTSAAAASACNSIPARAGCSPRLCATAALWRPRNPLSLRLAGRSRSSDRRDPHVGCGPYRHDRLHQLAASGAAHRRRARRRA